jgi:hypothetical protein
MLELTGDLLRTLVVKTVRRFPGTRPAQENWLKRRKVGNDTMIRTIARTIGFTTIAALTLAASMALAHDTHITGTVSGIDAATRTIYFTNGTAVQVPAGSVVTINGRQVAFETLTPGSNVTVSTAPSMGTVATQPPRSASDVAGTVARVDRQNGVILLQDGRAIRLSDRSVVWQATPIDAIQAGTQIYVPNAQLAVMAPQQPVVATPQRPIDASVRVGTVKSLDQNNSLIRLVDDTYVKVLRTTRILSAGGPMTFSQLRPGDQVAVWPDGRSSISATTTVPRGDAPPASAIEADYIEVTRVAS